MSRSIELDRTEKETEEVMREEDGKQTGDGEQKEDKGQMDDRAQKEDEEQRDDRKRKQDEEQSGNGERKEFDKLKEYGQITLDGGGCRQKIHLLSIIGEVEGHENAPGNSKTTKYDHVLPSLAAIEDNEEVEGLLVLLNTSGGDVDAGLAIAEMIASLSVPTVSLVLGGSHSIGVPLAVSTDYSFIVPTGTMMIHPVRMSGMVIGASQTYEYFEMIQDRILSFITEHSRIGYEQVKSLMLNTKMLTRDLGTVLVGREAVEHGLIDEVGGIRDALAKLHRMISDGGRRTRGTAPPGRNE